MFTPITIELPDATHHYLEQLAQQQGTTIQNIIASRLVVTEEDLPFDLTQELEALKSLSDDALWTIAREKLNSKIESRLEILANTKQPSSELTELLDRADRLMLRKAEASAILTKRGYKVELKDLR